MFEKGVDDNQTVLHLQFIVQWRFLTHGVGKSWKIHFLWHIFKTLFSDYLKKYKHYSVFILEDQETSMSSYERFDKENAKRDRKEAKQREKEQKRELERVKKEEKVRRKLEMEAMKHLADDEKRRAENKLVLQEQNRMEKKFFFNH